MTRGVAVRDVDHQLAGVALCLVTLSRLHALRLLAAGDRFSMLEAAEQAARYADLASDVDRFAARHYQHKSELVAWPRAMRPDSARILRDGTISIDALAATIAAAVGTLARLICALEAAARANLLAAPVAPVLAQVRSGVPEALLSSVGELAPDLSAPRVEKPRQVVSGPAWVQIDPVFKPTYSLLDRREPLFGDTLAEAVPYLWTVSIRETLAAELCSLSSVEYDGLPLAFYADMSKQAWDEMRHGIYYLDLALDMIPDLASRLDEGEPLLPVLRSFLRGEGRLPIPLEGNLYEAMLNANLIERLILFQIQTEGPSAARKKQQIESYLCRTHPDLRAALEYDIRDEISHARIGKTWLAHLLPDPTKRREAVATTAMLRGVLILTSFAHHHDVPLVQMIDQCLTGRVAQRKLH